MKIVLSENNRIPKNPESVYFDASNLKMRYWDKYMKRQNEVLHLNLLLKFGILM